MNVLLKMLHGSDEYLRKFLQKDGVFLGDFKQDMTTRGLMNINFKLMNFSGDMVIKVRSLIKQKFTHDIIDIKIKFQPGLDHRLSAPLDIPQGKEAYILLKVLKQVCEAPVKSYQIKKVLHAVYNDLGNKLPADVLE